MSTSTPPGSADELRADIDRITAQLQTLPLARWHRDERLKLNEIREHKESQLHAVLRGARVKELQDQLDQLKSRLLAIDRGMRATRAELLRAKRSVEVELEMLMKEP